MSIRRPPDHTVAVAAVSREGTPGPTRRRLAGLALSGLAAALAMPAIGRVQAPVQLRDVLGRGVTLPRPARRVVLEQGRHLTSLGLVHPDPASLLVGWRGDFRRDRNGEYAAWLRRFPQLDSLPLIANGMDAPDLERILATQPDLVIYSRWGADRGGGAVAPAIGVLEGAGIPVAVVDFFIHPFEDTTRSLAILGQLLGREEQTAALTAFRQQRLDEVARRMAGLTGRPLVMMNAHAGSVACCASPGRGTFDDMIRAAGGENLGAHLLSTPLGQIAPEQVLSMDPPIFVATGGSFGGQAGLRIGGGVTEAEARDSLARLMSQPPLSGLSARATGRVHGIWHGFNDTPAHFLMVEALARWIQPGRGNGLEPRRSLEALNRRFAAVPMEGCYWVDLDPQR